MKVSATKDQTHVCMCTYVYTYNYYDIIKCSNTGIAMKLYGFQQMCFEKQADVLPSKNLALYNVNQLLFNVCNSK